MAIKDALLPEFDHEMGTTRRLLERAPEREFGWKPHAKSMSLGELTTHLSNIPTWCPTILTSSVLDLEAIPEDARPKPFTSSRDLLAAFDAKTAAARTAIAGCGDGEMMSPWTLKRGSHEVFTMPRAAALRSFVMSHIIHHRGQLSVYLRLKDVPLPAIYGPTADEA